MTPFPRDPLLFRVRGEPGAVVVRADPSAGYVVCPDTVGGWRDRISWPGDESDLEPIPKRERPALIVKLSGVGPSVGNKEIARLSQVGWGGKREGSGRKPVSDEPLARVTATLPESDAAFVRSLGGGNASAGIRALVEAARNKPTPSRQETTRRN